MTTSTSTQMVPRQPAAAPALRAADQGVADSLESVLSDNTRRVYGAQWRLFNDWCDSVVLRSLPAEPLTVARYLAVRAGDGASIATLRLATSAIAKVHEWADHDSPCRDRGVREALKGWGRRLARPQRQAGALTADVLAVIRLTAPKPRARGRGFETPAQAAERARFDLALVSVLSDGGLRRSEAAALTWGDVQRWDDGSGRITPAASQPDRLCVTYNSERPTLDAIFTVCRYEPIRSLAGTAKRSTRAVRGACHVLQFARLSIPTDSEHIDSV